jgi:hypothetical protein
MDQNGQINDLGKQYIGAELPSTISSGVSLGETRRVASCCLALIVAAFALI